MRRVGWPFKLSWYFYAWCGGNVEKPNSSGCNFYVKVPSWGRLVQIWPDCALKHCKIPSGMGLCHLCPNTPDYWRMGNVSWILPCLRSSLCSLEICALSMEMVALGSAFVGAGVQKMGMECLQGTEWLEFASSGEHKCYLTRTWIDFFWNIVYRSDDPCPRKINWCKESLLMW